MTQYIINVLSTFSRDITVEADSEEVAIKQAKTKFFSQTDRGNFLDAEFEVIEEVNDDDK